MRRSVTLLVPLVLAAALAQAGSARPLESARTADAKLTLVAYSTPREAYGQIIPLFQKSAAGENGYRPVVKSVARQFSFPARPGIFTINQLGIGGWARVQKQFFDPRNGIFTKIQAKAARG